MSQILQRFQRPEPQDAVNQLRPWNARIWDWVHSPGRLQRRPGNRQQQAKDKGLGRMPRREKSHHVHIDLPSRLVLNLRPLSRMAARVVIGSEP